jgi:hypothetical protein
MKTPIHSRYARWCTSYLLPTLVAILMLPSPAQAINYYWDTVSGNSQIDAGSGSWNAVTSNTAWSIGATGTTNVYWSSGTDVSAVFAGTSAAANTYVISVGSGIRLQNITFNSTGYLLTASTATTINMGAALTGYITLGSGVTANIGDNITLISGTTGGSQPLTITGTGASCTLVVSASSASTAATLKAGANNNIVITNGATLVMGSNSLLLAGTSASGTGSIVVGNTSGTNADATLTLNGGLVNFNNLVLGNSGTTGISTVNLERGTLASLSSSGTLRFGPTSGTVASGTSIVNLDGGVLSIGSIAVGIAGSAYYYTISYQSLDF